MHGRITKASKFHGADAAFVASLVSGRCELLTVSGDYDVAAIMRQAWARKRNAEAKGWNDTFAYCLRRAWEKARTELATVADACELRMKPRARRDVAVFSALMAENHTAAVTELARLGIDNAEASALV